MRRSEAKPSDDRAVRDARARIAILGAGFSGLAAAIALKRRGYEDFVIYEKADDIGGTWRDNVYPGVACDVPSHLYSFSFETNADWLERFSSGAEILAYLKSCARKHELYSRTRFGRKIVSLRHDGRVWSIGFEDGSQSEADIVISGLGGLHVPHVPDFKGLESFRGPKFHSAQWRADIDLCGKRVAVIGTGSSAAQIVPEIQPIVGRLDVYQRTPSWVMPRPDAHYPKIARMLFQAAPISARLYRAFYFFLLEARRALFKSEMNLIKRIILRNFRKHMERQIEDPVLRRKLTPDYPVGCKRVVISNAYLPALQQANAEVVAAPIAQFESGGIRTEDGVFRETDIVVLATGFRPFDLHRSIEIASPSGLTLEQAWKGGVAAHRTVAVPGFPNFFMMFGPNSAIAHSSVILMCEAQAAYIAQLIQALDSSGCALIEPGAEAAVRYDAALQATLKTMVWAKGCKSWYLDEWGRNYTLYPNSTRRFQREMKKPDLAEYRFASGVGRTLDDRCGIA